MKNDNRITVAVPTLNSAATLEATLLSLRAQAGCAVDIVVADSGSTDATLDICRRLGVPTVYVEPGNMYKAINAVLRGAATPWLAYLNSDDTAYPDAFSRLIARAEETGAGVVYGRCDYTDYGGRLLYTITPARPRCLAALFRWGLFGFAQQAAIFRAGVYKELGGFDEKYRFSSDADFYARAVRAGIAFESLGGGAVAAFRLHGGQLTNKYSGEMEAEKLAIRAACGSRGPGDLLAYLAWKLRNTPNYLRRWLRARRLRGEAS